MRVDHGRLPDGAVFAGVDTHADEHWLCVLDAVGRPLLSERFPAAPEGYDALVRANCPALLAMYGCGVVSAARLAVAAGDNPQRMASEAAFAALCGASPVEASSGRTVRHRLNRGGDRRANSALHQIARHRLNHDPRTVAYAERRRSEGMSEKEILRCLKRHVAREAYRALTGRARARPDGPAGLRAKRRAAKISQEAAGRALGVSKGLISLIEHGRGGSPSMCERYRAWVENGFPIPAD